jgi:hypothetical protein
MRTSRRRVTRRASASSLWLREASNGKTARTESDTRRDPNATAVRHVDGQIGVPHRLAKHEEAIDMT